MELSPRSRRRARYLVPLGAGALTAAIVFIPQAASGVQHPNLPPKTAAALLASLEQAHLPQFSGTTVETAHLGLPNIGGALPAGLTPSGQSQLLQIVTLLTGSHTTQIAYGGPDKQRVAIFLSDLSEMDVVHNGTDLWTYSSDSNTVTHSTLKQPADASNKPDVTTPVNPTKAAEQALAKINPSTKVTVDRTAEVAGRPAYQLDLNPRDSRSLISSVRIALDSANWMPLRVQIWSRNSTSSPAFSVGFTSLSLSPPNSSTFDFTKPPSATLAQSPFSGNPFSETPLHAAGSAARAASAATHRPDVKTIGKDWTTVFVGKVHTTKSFAVGPNGTMIAPGHTKLGVAGSTPLPRVHVQNGKVVGPNGKPIRVPASSTFGGSNVIQEIEQLGTAVPGGHIITTNLVTVMLTNDNRILIGAVTPAYIEHVAASKAAQ
jgi:outer membrane lipoprotein-sorting protein